MKQLTVLFKIFSEIIKNPMLLRKILDDNRVWAKYIEKRHPAFTGGLPVVEINELFPDFKETLDVIAFVGGGSTAPDFALIKGLCKSVPDCNYFEIGTWVGESVANASQVCKECYTLNLDPEKLANGKFKKFMAFFSNGLKNVKHIYGNSQTFDFAGLNKKFDVIFVDGDHHFEFIKNDTQNVFNALAHENTIIIWHDYGTDPSTPRFETLAGILGGIPADLHKNLYHVSNTMCAIYTNRKFNTRKLQSPEVPNKKFRVILESSKI